MMPASSRVVRPVRPSWPGPVARIVAASAGGYGLAVLFARAAAGRLPLAPADAVTLGLLGSFAVWCGTAIWCFAAATAGRAWFGLGLAALGIGALLLLPHQPLAAAMAPG